MAGRLPTFVIVGAMRSGTTALARHLGAHPDVFMAEEKEIHFFDRHWARGQDWYRGRFVRASGERMVGEATPAYLYHPEVPARMAEVLPEARLIAILRNPVDRAYSHYWLQRGLGRERRGFAEAIEEEEREGPVLEADFAYLGCSRYLPQLQRMGRYFARASLLVLVFEELQRDPGTLYRTACRFLGIDPEYAPSDLGRLMNPYRDYRSLRLRLYTRSPPPTVLKRALARLNTVRGSSYPPLDPVLREELSSRFAGPNAALAEWLGRDLSVWGR
jgi:hypothetical protein